MAILFSQADGSDQHYDTYEEFEQAFVLLKRLNGEKVPQDLLDEVKAKYGVKDPKPFQVQIDGRNFEPAIIEATRELAEAIDETAKDRTPVSDECENPEKEPNFEVGDKVKVVENKSGGHPKGTVGVIGSVSYDKQYYTYSYGVDCNYGFHVVETLYHDEVELEYSEDSPTEFRTGDVVLVTETFEDNYGDSLQGGDLHRFGKLNSGRVCISAVFVDGDNLDKLRLVCRREDRKDIEL